MADNVAILPVIVASLLLPKLSGTADIGRKYVLMKKAAVGIAVILAPLLAATALLAPWAVRALFGKAFAPAAPATSAHAGHAVSERRGRGRSIPQQHRISDRRRMDLAWLCGIQGGCQSLGDSPLRHYGSFRRRLFRILRGICADLGRHLQEGARTAGFSLLMHANAFPIP